VGVGHGEAHNAFTAAWVMQVSFDPLLLALSINPRHPSYGLLNESRAFGISVLKESQLDLAGYYGQPGSADKKLTLTEWTTDRIGLPLLRDALAWFECKALRPSTVRAIRIALEDAGCEFICEDDVSGPGMRMRKKQVRIWQSWGARRRIFFANLLTSASAARTSRAP
jgi:Flavin reductase like domain